MKMMNSNWRDITIIAIWMFPKIEVTANHPFIGFSTTNHPQIGDTGIPSFYGNLQQSPDFDRSIPTRHPFGPITAEVLLSLPGDVGESYREQWNKLVSLLALITCGYPQDGCGVKCNVWTVRLVSKLKYHDVSDGER